MSQETVMVEEQRVCIRCASTFTAEVGESILICDSCFKEFIFTEVRS